MPKPPDNATTLRDIARLRRLAQTMDSAIRLPVIGVRLGWDSILGLVPGVGDVLALLPSLYILRESHRIGAPKSLLARMGANVGIDLAIGTVPLIGDIFDVGWKANLRNVSLLERHVQDRAAATSPLQPPATPPPHTGGRHQQRNPPA